MLKDKRAAVQPQPTTTDKRYRQKKSREEKWEAHLLGSFSSVQRQNRRRDKRSAKVNQIKFDIPYNSINCSTFFTKIFEYYFILILTLDIYHHINHKLNLYTVAFIKLKPDNRSGQTTRRRTTNYSMWTRNTSNHRILGTHFYSSFGVDTHIGRCNRTGRVLKKLQQRQLKQSCWQDLEETKQWCH